MKRVFFLVFTLILIVSLSSCSIEKDIFYLTSPKGEKVTDEHNESDKPNNETVYWLEKGSVYHLYKDCYYLKDKKYLSGTLEECELAKLCSRCEKRSKKG